MRIDLVPFAVRFSYSGQIWAYIGLPLEIFDFVVDNPVSRWINKSQEAGEEKDWRKFYERSI